MVGGKAGFLYLDKNEMPKITPHVCRQRIVPIVHQVA